MLHQKADGIAAFATTKTFINFFGRRNRERRSPFVMKRAETKVISASFFQFHKAADHINNIDATENLLYGILRYHGLLISDLVNKR